MKMKSDTLYQIILSVLAEEATDEERRQLTAWLAASDSNKQEFEKMKRLYRVSSVSEKEKQVDFDVDQAWKHVQSQTVDKKKQFEFRRWLSYAAMLMMIVGVSVYLLQDHGAAPMLVENTEVKGFDEPTLLLDNGEEVPLGRDSFSIRQEKTVIRNHADQLSYLPADQQEGKEVEPVRINRVVIPKGKAYELMLADGTHVWLNAESELTFPTSFTGKERRVTLKGEGYFDVSKDPEKPFYVETNGVKVKVLGTSFNVSRYANEQLASVTLVEGLVSVETENGKHIQITPSERLTMDTKNCQTEVRTVDTRLYTSWVEGKYIFKDATLDEIFQKLHHWYDFSLNYSDDRLKGKRFSLVVDRNVSLDQLLELISFTSKVKLERIGMSIQIKEEKEVQ